MKKDIDGQLHLSHNHANYAQVQGEIAILNVEWCDIVVFSKGEVVVDRILADLDYWDNLQEKMKQFYLHHVEPELLSKRIFLEQFGTAL